MSLAITILGCGSSGGVPRVASGWGACDPAEPRNRRRRCAILVEQSGPDGSTRVLVDTGPDVREQLIDAQVRHLDAVLYSHAHADHIHGIDDLRPLVIAMRRVMPVYMDQPTSDLVTDRFSYCFVAPPNSEYPPIVREHRMTTDMAVRIEGAGGTLTAMPFRLEHGSNMDALGFRFGAIAYTPDVSAIPDAALPHLRDLDVWIIDALRRTPHPTHFSLSDALAWIARMKPRHAVLTNLHTDLDYATLLRELPAGVEPAYDGMRIEA